MIKGLLFIKSPFLLHNHTSLLTAGDRFTTNLSFTLQSHKEDTNDAAKYERKPFI